MTATTSPQIGQIQALLAEKGYEISETAPDTLKLRELESGVAIQAVLEGEILFFSCLRRRPESRRHAGHHARRCWRPTTAFPPPTSSCTTRARARWR